MEVTKKSALRDEKRESSRQSYRPGPFDYQRLDAFRVDLAMERSPAWRG